MTMIRAIAVGGQKISRNRPASQVRRRKRPVVKVNLIAWAVAILSFVIGCLVYVQARTTVIRERYNLQEVQRKLEETKAENRKLRVAWGALTSPRQIDKAAGNSHFHYPSAQEVVRLP